LAARVQDHPRVYDRADRMQAELELGHHAEVPASAPEAPEELGVLVYRRPDDPASRGHDLGSDQALAGRPVLTLQPARAAAERQPRDAGVRNAPTGDRKPVRLRGGVQFAPSQSGAEAARALLDVDRDFFHRTDVDYHAAVTARVSVRGMSASAHGNGETVLARVGECRLHVLAAPAARDDCGPRVEHPVVELARGVVAGIVGFDELSRECRSEGFPSTPFSSGTVVSWGVCAGRAYLVQDVHELQPARERLVVAVGTDDTAGDRLAFEVDLHGDLDCFSILAHGAIVQRPCRVCHRG
jgi:hypothetical protein